MDSPASPPPHQPWNILFIMTDQQRWDALGAEGGWVDTPALDRLAAEGVRFSNAVTNSPGCIPARASLATARYVHNFSAWAPESFTLDPDAANWMRAIRDRGYFTAVIGKTHLHPHVGDLRDRAHLIHSYGFDTVHEIAGPWASRSVGSEMTDEWQKEGLLEAFRRDLQERSENKRHVVRPSPLGLEYFYDTYVGQSARAFLRDYRDRRPWFLWVSFAGPHDPWDTPEPYASRYRASEMPPPVRRPTGTDQAPTGVLHKWLSSKGPWNPGLDDEEVPRLRASYAGEVTLIDDQIAGVIDTIRDRGELDRTVIAFTSDHGEMNGDYGLLGKGVFLNGAVRVPFIIRTPETARATRERVYSGPVELMDMGVTLAELAGSVGYQLGCGKSLCPVLRGDAALVRTEALSEFAGEYMLLTDEWKVAFRSDLMTGTRNAPFRMDPLPRPYLLFNVHDDPREERNLAGGHQMAEVEAALTNLLRDRIAEAGPAK